LKFDDGKITSESGDESIMIWDLKENFKYSQAIQGHTEAVSRLLKLDDGKIVSGAEDKIIMIWDSKENFNCTQTLKDIHKII